MSEFRTPLDLRLICPWANDGRGEWEFLSDLRYYSARLESEVVVPAGFRYDTASVPRLAIAYALFGGRYNRSAGVHDYYCRTGLIARKVADQVFLEAMRAENEEEIAALAASGADDEAIEARRNGLEGQAQIMYAAVAVRTLFDFGETEAEA